MPQVICPGCNQAIRLTAENEGRKAKCSCGKVLVMPQLPRAAQRPQPAAALIKFNCPSCATLLQVAASYAGQQSTCPCGAQFAVPAASTVPQAPMQTPGGQSFVPEYHKRAQAKKKRIARAKERAEQEQRERKKAKRMIPQPESDNSIPATAWTGIAMILAGALWLFAGMFAGWIYYAPIAVIVIGVCVAVFGALFGDVEED